MCSRVGLKKNPNKRWDEHSGQLNVLRVSALVTGKESECECF